MHVYFKQFNNNSIHLFQHDKLWVEFYCPPIGDPFMIICCNGSWFNKDDESMTRLNITKGQIANVSVERYHSIFYIN